MSSSLMTFTTDCCEKEYIERISDVIYRKSASINRTIVGSEAYIDRLRDFVFCAYGNPHSKDVIEAMRSTNSCKKTIRVAIHFGDENECTVTAYHFFDYVFRFYMPHTCDMKKVFPINIGFSSLGMTVDETIVKSFSKEPRTINTRENDVFFIGQSGISVSRDAMFALKSILKRLKTSDNGKAKVKIKKTNGFGRGVDMKTYRRLLDSSKICLVPGGMSPETFRYTEAMASGCIVVTDCANDSVYYYKNAPIIKIDKWNADAVSKIQSLLLKTDDELNEMGRASRTYYETVLSPEATADYILDIITKAQ